MKTLRAEFVADARTVCTPLRSLSCNWYECPLLAQS